MLYSVVNTTVGAGEQDLSANSTSSWLNGRVSVLFSVRVTIHSSLEMIREPMSTPQMNFCGIAARTVSGVAGPSGEPVNNSFAGESGRIFGDCESPDIHDFTTCMSLVCGMIPNEGYHALAR